MKTITPINVWYNGGMVEANAIDAIASNDNLVDSVDFPYAIFFTQDGKNPIQLQNGILKMTGQDYVAYETNQYAWDWIASKLNITITGEYIMPFSPFPVNR